MAESANSAFLIRPALVAAALADAFAGDAKTAAEQRGTFNVALAGGTTPKAAYELLAQEPRRSLIDWNTVQVFFGDERCVPPDNPESNYKMAADAFLNAVDIPARNVHRMPWRGRSPKKRPPHMRPICSPRWVTPPIFDLIMLGMGPDGHTASLFPGIGSDDRSGRARARCFRREIVGASNHGYAACAQPSSTRHHRDRRPCKSARALCRFERAVRSDDSPRFRSFRPAMDG